MQLRSPQTARPLAYSVHAFNFGFQTKNSGSGQTLLNIGDRWRSVFSSEQDLKNSACNPKCARLSSRTRGAPQRHSATRLSLLATKFARASLPHGGKAWQVNRRTDPVRQSQGNSPHDRNVPSQGCCPIRKGGQPVSVIPPSQGTSVPCPKKDPRGYLPVLGIKASRKYALTCISSTVYGKELHYDGKRTLACLGTPQTCPLHAQGLPWRWYGFVGAVDHERRVWLIQLTVGAYQWSPSLQQLDGSLRGRKLDIYRLKDRNNSPMRVVVSSSLGSVASIPEPDLEYSVLRLFNHVGGLRLVEENAQAEAPRPKRRRKGKVTNETL